MAFWNCSAQRAVLLSIVAFVIGCSPRSTDNVPTETRDSQHKGSRTFAAPVARIAEAKLDAEELAHLGRLQAWAFEYTGGPIRCWLEIEETGQQTMTDGEPPGKDPQAKRGRKIAAKEGKIALVIRETGIDDMFVVALWYFGEREKSSMPVWFLKKPLWFAWDGFAAHDQTPLSGRPASPEEGRELTLHVWDRTELNGSDGADSSPPRRVILRLKAAFDKSSEK
jgi:hypothetical protein